MKIKLKVWRQNSNKDQGFFETHNVENISDDMSFFEMLDMLNNNLIKANKSPIAFDHDCREGICGTCGVLSVCFPLVAVLDWRTLGTAGCSRRPW